MSKPKTLQPVRKFAVTVTHRRQWKYTVEGVSHETYAVSEYANVFKIYGPEREVILSVTFPAEALVACEEVKEKKPKVAKMSVVPIP